MQDIALIPLSNNIKKPSARFSAALLKIASRCNLNCDYCYMYKHEDQSWKNQPQFMGDDIIRQFAQRLNEYVEYNNLSAFSVILHGGEPLLYGGRRINRMVEIIKESVNKSCKIDFSIQTNGVLLDNETLTDLYTAGVSVSISLDGPQHANDIHRLNHKGLSTFSDTLNAINNISTKYPDLFGGVIAVIDPSIPARDIFDFFSPMNLPRLDLLLPDATHSNPPPGRASNPQLYKDWLEDAYELWFTEYPHLPIRWFDTVLSSRLGVPSPTDIMGFGSVNLIVIETNGQYTDHDVFKITRQGGALLGYDLFSASFEDMAHHPNIQEHGYRLTIDGIAKECTKCPVMAACSGGCVMHRYHPSRSLDAPTVYCSEMFNLLSKATILLRDTLEIPYSYSNDPNMLVPTGTNLITECTRWRASTDLKANSIKEQQGIVLQNIPAAAIILQHSRDKSKIVHLKTDIYPQSYWLNNIRIQLPEPSLTDPFLDSINVLSPESDQVIHGIQSLPLAAKYLGILDPSILEAISILISDIIFVESTLKEESGIFSFSDDTAPNVLYIAPYAGGKPLPAEDIADSILHEFLHQVLYHIENDGVLLFDHVFPQFPAPWRAGLRPSGGFLHGTFVFAGLSRYWKALLSVTDDKLDRAKVDHNARTCYEQALYGIASLRDFALLTPRGLHLLGAMESQLSDQPIPSLIPPGSLL